MTDALNSHTSLGSLGKLAKTAANPPATWQDLNLVYTPGVAEPVKDISRDPGALTCKLLPQDEIKAYNLHHLEYGRNWFIPKPLDKRLYTCLPPVIVQVATMHGESRLLLDEIEYRKRLQSEVSEL